MITVSPLAIFCLGVPILILLIMILVWSTSRLTYYRRTVLYPENTLTIITEVDRAYRIRYTNVDSPEFEFFAYPTRTIFEITPPNYHQVARATFEKVLQTKVSESYEHRTDTESGHYIWYRTEIDPIISRNRITGFRLVTHNIASDKLAALLLESYNHVLEMLAHGADLSKVLYDIAVMVEAARPNTLCTIMLLDNDKKQLWSSASPTISAEYMDAINGGFIGPDAGSCGAAVFRRERVIVGDIMTHPYWVNYQEFAVKAGLRACWSEPIFDSAGNILGALGMYYREIHTPDKDDLTLIQSVAHLAGIAIENSFSRQKLQESFNKIKRAKQEWESTVDSLDHLIALLDRQQNILRVNRAISNWGSNVREVRGKAIQTLFHSADFQPQLEHAWEHLESGKTTAFEFTEMRNGTHLLAQLHPISTIAYKEKGHAESYAVMVITDISQQKRLEQAQLESQEVRIKLEMDQKVIGIRQDFVSAVSHEFRTPLAVIKSSKDILQRYQNRLTPERQQIHFDRIDEQVSLMVEMVDQVLFISQTADNRISVRLERINLSDFCNSLLTDLDLMSDQSHNLMLYPHNTEIVLLTDIRLLRQIISNLVTNAIKYSPPASTISVKLGCEGDFAVVMVIDQGIGIPPEEQASLFEPFYRASNANDIKGTGLGMTVVKNAVDVLHGQISFTSQPGEGSTFIVHLPMTQKKE